MSSPSTPWVVFAGTTLQLITGTGGGSHVAGGALGRVVQLEGLFWVLRIRLCPMIDGLGNLRFSSRSLLQYVAAIQNLNKKQWNTFPRTSYCVLSVAPPFFYFVGVLWLKRGNEHSEITVFLPCFDPSPSFPPEYF